VSGGGFGVGGVEITSRRLAGFAVWSEAQKMADGGVTRASTGLSINLTIKTVTGEAPNYREAMNVMLEIMELQKGVDGTTSRSGDGMVWSAANWPRAC